MFMNHPGFMGGFAARRAADVGASAASIRKPDTRAGKRELELKLAALQKDYAALHTALFEAAQVHRRLCAPRVVRHGNFEVASEIFAVRQLPGDFFTAKETTSGVLLALGDVSGKGLAASMWITHLAGLVATHTEASPEPQAIATAVNRDFCRMSAVPLATLFLATLDPFTGRLDYCSAGHPPALLLRADGWMESLSEGGPLLGVVPSASFAQGRVELRPGDVLVAYSDGVLDSTNNAGEDFGYQRLKQQLRQMEKSSADAVLFSLLGAVQDFAEGRPLEDDISLVVLRRDTVEDRNDQQGTSRNIGKLTVQEH
jgi:serine phosphatase RsbU (regulator of sigma subunit)